jgi:hypothetical protein
MNAPTPSVMLLRPTPAAAEGDEEAKKNLARLREVASKKE